MENDVSPLALFTSVRIRQGPLATYACNDAKSLLAHTVDHDALVLLNTLSGQCSYNTLFLDSAVR